uniref:Acyltransferase 3 domain-containing protein n=1 Tax=Acyrthosiphon pisum TaxID=7029 RepID=A0A8R2FC30_ACYPI|eukprot:XP_008188377.1 PREDICTED: uncharacterized protein HI_0392-like [Acyrthosiphon pisum]
MEEMESGVKESKQHLYSLDFLRGIAAYIVIFWHWKMLFYVNNNRSQIDSKDFPFYDLFSIFYNHGLLAVEFFFCLSGFIFFYYFRSKIVRGTLSAKDFAVDRISRIYPLHIFTFLLVGLLQYTSMESSGYYLAFIYNDSYHALLNVFMLHAWGVERGFSFNAPSWSISIESLLYLMFFVSLKIRMPKLVIALFMILLGALLYSCNYNISVGIFSFFIGGALAMSCEHLSSKMSKIWLLVISLIILSAGLSILIYRSEFNALWVAALFFAPVIFTFTSISAISPLFLKRFKFLGDISYSLYLIHFPLMILASIFVNKLGIDKSIYLQEYFFISFVVVLTLLGFISHYYFEMPIMKLIRNSSRKQTSNAEES